MRLSVGVSQAASSKEEIFRFAEVPGPTETKPAFFDTFDLATLLTLVNCAENSYPLFRKLDRVGQVGRRMVCLNPNSTSLARKRKSQPFIDGFSPLNTSAQSLIDLVT